MNKVNTTPGSAFTKNVRRAVLLATPLFALTLHAQTSYYQPVTFTSFAGLAFTIGTNDGTHTGARFHSPTGVAVDASGTIYVADLGNGEIRRISPNGTVITLAGAPFAAGQGSVDGTGSAAKFNYPYALAVDPTGSTIYVSDEHNCTIRKVTSDGVVTTLAGLSGTPVGSPNLGSADGTGSAASFRYPLGIGIDSTGNVFVCDSANSTIRKITPEGVVTTFAGLAQTPGSTDGAGSSARFVNPTGLAIDSADNIFVSDYSDNTIRKITPAGVVTTVAGTPGTSGSADGIGANASFLAPDGLALDAAGNLYIADQNNHTIRKMNRNSGVSTIGGTAGSPGAVDGLGSSARFYYPAGVAVSSSGYLYVADENSQLIRRAFVGVRDHDLNADGKSDVIWQNSTTGDRYLWLMNGTDFSAGIDLGTVSPAWRITGTADFNGDGKTDILFENTTTGDRYIWMMDGTTYLSGFDLGIISTDLKIVGTADFNGDGKTDILWENSVTGKRVIWLMNDTALLSTVNLGLLSTDYHIVAAADFNGDGKPDILFENTVTGDRYIWLMNGTAYSSGVDLGLLSTDWHMATAADFNGDGKTDILLENTVTGDRYVWLMNGTAYSSGVDLGVVTTDWRIAN